jgi:hypothetical protein
MGGYPTGDFVKPVRTMRRILPVEWMAAREEGASESGHGLINAVLEIALATQANDLIGDLALTE